MTISSSPTSKILNEFEQTMKSAIDSFDFRGAENEAIETGVRLKERIHSGITRGISTEAAKPLLTLMGRRAKLAILLGNRSEEISSNEDFGMLILYTVFPDRDEARRLASKIFYQAGESRIQDNDRNSAAASFTNSMLCLLELSYPTKDELWFAHKTLSRTRNWRQKESVDSAYHSFQMALATKKLVEIGEISPLPDVFRKILRGFDRAQQLFKRHKHDFDEHTYHQNVIDVLTDWITWQISKSEQELADPIAEIAPLQAQFEGINNAQLTSLLRTNPAILGFSETPTWIPSKAEVLKRSIQEIPKFDARLNAATRNVKTNPSSPIALELSINRLQRIMAPLRGHPELPFAELESLWTTQDYGNYISRALNALSHTLALEESSTNYVQLLSRIQKAILILRKTWPELQLHKILRRYPAALRFAACELGRLEQWEDAFELLEMTRGLIVSTSASLINAPTVRIEEEDDYLWVHLTHSPNGTYLICAQNGKFFGATFPEISGTVLSSLFSGFHPLGLLVPRSENTQSARANSIDRISKVLAPISEWILKQDATTVVVLPGGYFQAFPVWSLGNLPTAIEKGEICYFQVPSRFLSKSKDNSKTRLRHSLSIQEATAIPYQDVLSFANEECSWIEVAAPSHWTSSLNSGTPGSILQASLDNEFIHFAGHSNAHPDPLKSALHTYAGPLTVERIARSKSNAQLVVLGSCESGLPMNFQLQDEYLSIQSAFWYSGCQYAIGTFWPVGDRVAMGFAKTFYTSLFTKISNDAPTVGSSVYLSWVNAVGELRKLFPNSLDWAAFSLLGSPTTVSIE